ncbi:hypothetical protein KCU61_g8826, partial [Aureobasidium melanogenum]
MLSTTSYVFSNDARATAFRRAVRSGVARRQGYAVPGPGASAQEVQRAYLRYCAEQQNQGQSGSAQQPPPPYMLAMDNQAPPAYSLETQHHTPPACTPSAMEQAPPPYTSTPASEMTPTAQLDMLLYSNTSTPPSPPEYTEAITTTPPPSYDSVVSTRTTSITTTDQTPSRTSMNMIFAGSITGTSRKQVQKQAIQALDLVVVSGTVGTELPARSSRRPGILIAGPIVKLDVRTLYLKDLSFFGCTFQEDEVFTNLIGYIERGEIRPRAGKVYPLDEIVDAQKHFNSKSTCGKLVLSIP